jgi:DNA-binding MltR family transcriptional regulator
MVVMSKALNEFLRGPLDQAEFKRLETESRRSSARGAVMIVGAIIDDILADAIRSKLVNTDKDEELFGVERPLGTFGARLKLAYALGLVSKKMYHDMDNLRKIRNAFAHGLRHLTFDTPEIATLVRGMHCAKDLKGYETASVRRIFIDATETMSLYLAQHTATHLPQNIRDDLKELFALMYD